MKWYASHHRIKFNVHFECGSCGSWLFTWTSRRERSFNTIVPCKPTRKWASERTNDIRPNRESCSFQLALTINPHFISLVSSLSQLCVCCAVCIRSIAVHCYRFSIIVFFLLRIFFFFLVRVIFNYFTCTKCKFYTINY